MEEGEKGRHLEGMNTDRKERGNKEYKERRRRGKEGWKEGRK